eukprot:UN12713
MDDFLNAADDKPTDQQMQPTGDAVVVNQTGTDEFAFMDENNPYDQVDDSKNIESEPQKPDATEDIFASMVEQKNENDALLLGSGGDADLKQDQIGGSEQKEKTDVEPTFLSVWLEERKLELEKRRNQEKEAQAELLETAQIELEKFESDRAKRIENKKKENREKENDLRDDLDAVFKHGTIWEQVGKMVNLNEKMAGLNKFEKDRFRDLLIQLRNAKQWMLFF